MAKYVLQKKQTSKNEDWVSVKNNIEEYISYDECKELVEKTVDFIVSQTKGKKCAYGFSGGKDSIALKYVCELAGVNDCVLGIASGLEFPSFLKWIEDNKPKCLTIIDNKELTVDWLAKHPNMLFPELSSDNSKFYQMIQHSAQNKYFKEHDLDMVILGRRYQDGNYIGNRNLQYENGKGVVRFSPIANWKHEDVFACIHYFCNDNYPPIYDYPNGYIRGSGVWCERRPWCNSQEECLEEIYAADKSVLENAAKKIQVIKNFLKNKQ